MRKLCLNPHSPPGGLYQRLNRAHQDWLLWELDRIAVPFSRIDDFGGALHGRPAEDFGKFKNKWFLWKSRHGKSAVPGDNLWLREKE